MTSSRNDLSAALDRVLDTLAAPDEGRPPFSPDVKYTENGQPLKLNDGLWQTISSVEDFRIDALDPATSQAVFYGLINENGVLASLALRVKVTGSEITEIEAVRVPTERSGPSLGANGSLSSQTMFMPRPLVEFDPAQFARPSPVWTDTTPVNVSRAAVVDAADAYFDGIEQDRSAGVPLDQYCARRENGIAVAHNPDLPPVGDGATQLPFFRLDCAEQLDSGFLGYISRVRRRHLVVDEERGLLFGVYLFDHGGTVASVDVAGGDTVVVPAGFRVPSTFLAPHLFKINDGKLVGIDTVLKAAPYGVPSGWE